jgi:tetratricopeptide (TPR) repeat protein
MNKQLGTLALFGIILLTFGCTDKTLESQKYIREADIALYESRIEKARELFEKAAELNPENEEAWYGIGVTYMNREKYQTAIEYFGKAIELNAGYTDAFYNRGQAYFYLGEVYRACDDWHIAYDLGKPNMKDKLRKCE